MRALRALALLALLATAPPAAAQAAGVATQSAPSRPARDPLPPVLSCPERVDAFCAGPLGARVEFTVSARDAIDRTPTLVCTPPSGSLFPPGDTLVTCSAMDDAGNQATCSFLVAVRDPGALALACPPDVVLEGTHAQGARFEFTPEVLGTCAAVEVVSEPASGSFFPLGLTRVACTASGPAGASAACDFTVTVRDSVAPTLVLAPIDLRIERSLAGTHVSFDVRATDACDPAPVLECSPPSGSFFPLGITRVTCSATDASGNRSEGEFELRVRATLGGGSSPGDPLDPGARPPGWYSGDTHEHVQFCDESVHLADEVLLRMEAEDLDVANMLIWERSGLPYTQFICFLSGRPDPLSDGHRLLQYGIETSGLDCSRWGHLIGLNVRPEDARIAAGSRLAGACEDMPGLGLGGDGTGTLNAPVALHFLAEARAVCGYAHTFWPAGLTHPDGYDWNAGLLASGFTRDARILDPREHLAFPNVERLMGIVAPPTSMRAFQPLLGAMDAVLGHVQFFETVVQGSSSLLVGDQPPMDWHALVYKLLSAGVRVAISGGSDRACLRTGPDYPRTWVRVDEELSIDSWTEGLAAGRSSVAGGAGTFLDLSLGGAEVGGELALASPGARATATVELRVPRAADDVIELLVNGALWDQRAVLLAGPGSARVTFDDVPFARSAWVAARLLSNRAHTGAVFVIVDGRPIADPAHAEYWMLWCDVVTKTTLAHPELEFFGAQEHEALALVARARRAFQTLRDAQGFDPGWGVEHYGLARPGCRGPLVIGASGPARRGEGLHLVCVNAPPDANGLLTLARRPFDTGARLPPRPDELPDLVATYPVRSTRSGWAEVALPAVPDELELHARFTFEHPSRCPHSACAGGESASDALSLRVQR
jgi:hypothetical protein